MRGLLLVGHGERTGDRIAGPPEHFVVQRQRRRVLNLVQQRVPLVLRQDVKRMDGMRDVISGERQLAFLSGVHVSVVFRKHRRAAVGTGACCILFHLSPELDMLLLGDRSAELAGIRMKRLKPLLMLAVTALSASVVSCSGCDRICGTGGSAYGPDALRRHVPQTSAGKHSCWRIAPAPRRSCRADGRSAAGNPGRNSDFTCGSPAPLHRIRRSCFLDEPAGALDIGFQHEFYRLLHSFARKGKCIVMISHDVFIAPHYLDEALLLKESTISARGIPIQVISPENLHTVFLYQEPEYE